MKYFFALLLALASVAISAEEQSGTTPIVSSQEMAHCGALFKMLASSASGADKSRYEFASTALQVEAAKSSSPTDVVKWMKEYFNGLPDKSAGPDAFFAYLQQTNVKCAPLANSVMKAALAKVGPEASKNNRITARYSNGRPSTASVFGKDISYSDSEGLGCEAPILVSGTEDREARIRSQYMWLEDQRPTLKVATHSTTYSEDATSKEALERVRIYSRFDMEAQKPDPKAICFDITASAKAELIRASDG